MSRYVLCREMHGRLHGVGGALAGEGRVITALFDVISVVTSLADRTR